MTLMLVLGVVLRFVQESRADAAAAKLKAMISVTAAVVREGQEEEIPLESIGPRRYREAVRRRHDPRRSAPGRCEGSFCRPGGVDRRVAANGKI